MTKYEFVVNWFKRNAKTKFTNAELERRLREEYESEYSDEFRDPLREARNAHERGVVHRTPKGRNQVYWYDPSL